MSDYLTVEEAAILARCHGKTIRRAVRAGNLRAFRPARRLLLRRDEVCAWIESRSAWLGPERPQAPRGRPRRLAVGAVTTLREMERDAAAR